MLEQCIYKKVKLRITSPQCFRWFWHLHQPTNPCNITGALVTESHTNQETPSAALTKANIPITPTTFEQPDHPEVMKVSPLKPNTQWNLLTVKDLL